MTELETLYFNNENQLRNAIADAVKEGDADALAKYDQEFSYEHRYYAYVSFPTTTEATITLEGRADAERLVEGDYDLYDKSNEEELEVHNEDHAYWDYECDDFCVGISCIKLRNPSAAALLLLRTKDEEQKEMRMRIRIGNLLDALMEDKGIKGYADKQSFIKEHASQLIKALIPQN